MDDIDIVTRLRGAASESYGCQCVKCEAAKEIERLTEIIVTLREEIKTAKARNVLLLSKLQEYEAREQ